MKPIRRHALSGLFAVLLGLPFSNNPARADTIFATTGVGIGEYTTAGATVNASLISGLTNPFGIAVSGSNLFVTNGAPANSVGEYTTSGAIVDPSLISGLNVDPTGIAVSGTNLFISNGTYIPPGVIGEYTTSGATVNTSLISGLMCDVPIAAGAGCPISGIAVSGSDLFVALPLNGGIAEYTTSGALVNPALIRVEMDYGPNLSIAASGSDLFVLIEDVGAIGEYTTSGATVNQSLISGLGGATSIAVDGSNLFVTNSLAGTIGEYTTSGATVNASLISGLNDPGGIAIVPTVAPVPEPGTLTLLGTALLGFVAIKRKLFL